MITTLEKIIQLLEKINDQHNNKLLSHIELECTYENIDALKNNFSVFLENLESLKDIDFSHTNTREATIPLNWGIFDTSHGIGQIKRLINIAERRHSDLFLNQLKKLESHD